MRMRMAWWLGALLLAMVQPVLADETVTYYLTDAQGTVLMTEDANGVTTATYDYRPYGASEGVPTPTGPGYTGHVNDPGTGLVYMQQRYYDPQVGQFLSVDPVMAYDSPAVYFNRYRYAASNPYRFTDPDGRKINGQYHQVVPGAYHLSIRITPDNQAAYQNDSRFLTDGATGERYATFGAGPEFGNFVSIPNSPNLPIQPIITIPTSVNLVSNNNRPSDAERSTHPSSNDIPVAVPSQYANEDQFIDAMFSADANYQDNVPYGMPGGSGYNSNSYANGLLQAVGAAPLVAPVSTPLSDHTLPREHFEK